MSESFFAVSSTEKRKPSDQRYAAQAASDAPLILKSAEHPLLTMAYKSGQDRMRFWQPVDGVGERTESVSRVNTQVTQSNRKDNRKAGVQPLLNATNSSRMLTFADQQHFNKAAADDGLMDRGAESAAGGLDVI